MVFIGFPSPGGAVIHLAGSEHWSALGTLTFRAPHNNQQFSNQRHSRPKKRLD